MDLRKSCFTLATLPLIAIMALPVAGLAAKGDCSQPSSTGPKPLASDCLYILKVAVNILTCSPECICAPKGTLPTAASDALLCLKSSVGEQVTLNCRCSLDVGDDFNDNTKDTTKWADDIMDGAGVLTETNQVLQFTTTGAGHADIAQSSRPWTKTHMPSNANWEVQMDIVNTSYAFNTQFTGFGILVIRPACCGSDFVDIELDSDMSGRNFIGEKYTNGDPNGLRFSANDFDGDGATRITFDAGTKVITLYYSAASNGNTWVELASYGVDDWGMSSTDTMNVTVYGYSYHVGIGDGTMYGDNFFTTGGVTP